MAEPTLQRKHCKSQRRRPHASAPTPDMRTRGHSMALGSMDPEIATDSDEVLLEGMVLVLHPNQYLPDTGYLMCGEPVLITPEGAQPLTSCPGELGSISV